MELTRNQIKILDMLATAKTTVEHYEFMIALNADPDEALMFLCEACLIEDTPEGYRLAIGGQIALDYEKRIVELEDIIVEMCEYIKTMAARGFIPVVTENLEKAAKIYQQRQVAE